MKRINIHFPHQNCEIICFHNSDEENGYLSNWYLSTTKSDKSELIEALDIIEKEKQISKEVILEAIENSLLAACKNQFGKSENIRVNINRETGEVKVFAVKEVVDDDDLEDEATQMGITEAILVHDKTEIGDTVEVEVTPKNFGRIAAQKAKQVVVQKIREEERKVLYVQYLEKESYNRYRSKI